MFDKTSSQEEVYEVVFPLIKFVSSDCSTLFAYGQLGTGKTYAIIGQEGRCIRSFSTRECAFKLSDNNNNNKT